MLQLIYSSAATIPFGEEDLNELLVVARRNNTQLGISGMLVYDEGSFLQVLEGEREAVLALYEKIEQDPRHDKVRMLLRVESDERSFADWKMGFIDTSQERAENIDGFIDFFRRGRVFDSAAGDRAKSILLQFRGGSWRQSVTVGNE